VLDRSLYSDRLLHGFDVFAFLELAGRPELAGHAVARPHLYFTYVFLFFSIVFLPGVLDGFASERRLSREDFWATCGRNLWRFVRLFVLNLLIAGIIFAVLMGINGALGKAAANSNNERLPFYVQLAGGIAIFLIMSWIRIWFDLAQSAVVINDEPRVRRSLRVAGRFAGRSLVRLLATYVFISLVAIAILLGGVWLWDVVISPANVAGAFLIAQVILFLFLAARFWQRACAIEYCVSHMKEDRVDEQLLPATAPVVVSPPLNEPGTQPA
jgi:hypothetical protein